VVQLVRVGGRDKSVVVLENKFRVSLFCLLVATKFSKICIALSSTMNSPFLNVNSRDYRTKCSTTNIMLLSMEIA
jgi:hypothetical protein